MPYRVSGKAMDRTIGIMAATACWAVSITLMVAASSVDDGGRQRVLIGWALLCGVAATLVTGWQIVERSRAKVMDYLAHQDLRITAAINAAMRGDRQPTRIR